ncbi:hypothetical protein ABIE08_004539 [Kaistia defluvii]|uniref:Uncharacterized protein n=1 Tax=Kaistia defluvii TaxID=410841 RepID=A0ABV2R5L8_9HYPH
MSPAPFAAARGRDLYSTTDHGRRGFVERLSTKAQVALCTNRLRTPLVGDGMRRLPTAAMPQIDPGTIADAENGLGNAGTSLADRYDRLTPPRMSLQLFGKRAVLTRLFVSILSETGRIEGGHPYFSAACPNFNGRLNIVRCFVERPKVDFHFGYVQRKEPAAAVRAERAAGISGHLPGIAELAHLPICRCQEERACRFPAIRTVTNPGIAGLPLDLKPNPPAQASTGSM